MSVQMQKPTTRVCERCGRTERWDDAQSAWQHAPDGERGNPHCIHEWDINGSFTPYE
ncbi:HEWD family protein [Natronosalvus halobius]|uniref:HEWD family protein n=1 Tax=Natronosalvus halobius TaxID=2953746 RepID=UPI00209FBD10|nr:HEWD family protein [Natronosalvus halobius]USZ72321.1 hypothetical protein NGM15_03135 [Natronosalvus halobius]